MTFYRHFCERDDFDIYVITDDTNVNKYSLPYSYSIINRGHVWQRLAKTRFSKAAHSWSHVASASVSQSVMRQVKKFNPEAVFTVAGSWSWTAKLAGEVAQKLKIPLVGSFNDWWYYNLIRYPWIDSFIEREFRSFYKRCDLALCTSQGMQDALGPHSNSMVLYPTGAALSQKTDRVDVVETQRPFTAAFCGNLGEWYGRMLEALITEAWQRGSSMQFKIFGSNASWSEAFDGKVKAAGIFQGQVPFDRLRMEMSEVDALLLLMGFDESCAQIERTSFKTKFLDYLTFQKPILLWGPDYCSAVSIAEEFDSAEVCTSHEPSDYLTTIEDVRGNYSRQQCLIKNAQRMYSNRFNPDTIHRQLVQKMKALAS